MVAPCVNNCQLTQDLILHKIPVEPASEELTTREALARKKTPLQVAAIWAEIYCYAIGFGHGERCSNLAGMIFTSFRTTPIDRYDLKPTEHDRRKFNYRPPSWLSNGTTNEVASDPSV